MFVSDHGTFTLSLNYYFSIIERQNKVVMNALPLRVTSTEQRTNLVIRRGKKMHSDILVTIREPKRKKKEADVPII